MAKKKAAKKRTPAKKRASKYEPKLKVFGTFADLVKTTVRVDKNTDKAT